MSRNRNYKGRNKNAEKTVLQTSVMLPSVMDKEEMVEIIALAILKAEEMKEKSEEKDDQEALEQLSLVLETILPKGGCFWAVLLEQKKN